MKQIKTFLLLMMLCFSSIAAFAQTVSTQGKEFWVSFMRNGHKYHSDAPNGGNWILTQVLVSGKRDCTGTITNPQTGAAIPFTVEANNITTVNISEEMAYIDEASELVVNKGLQIICSDTVSVFCTNIAHLSFDASYVLPIQSLADDYIIQTYDQSDNSSQHPYINDNQTSAFVIVATEDNTIVDITPSVITMSNRPPGEQFRAHLNKGQAYQVRSQKGGDLSGSRVTARDCKRIAVFNGNTLTAIPTNKSSYDHIFEQAMPVQSWGKRFVVTSSLEREKDVVKITSAAQNNEIFKNGTPIATLNTGESFEFELKSNDGSCFIESTGRVAVFLYNTTQGGNSIGDPSVVWISPVEQRIDEITFSTFNNENINIETHHVNIIINSEDIGNVYLDGQQISPNSFAAVNGNSEYSYARKNIQHGVHHLQCANGFNAHVYGFGLAKGYAYSVGSKTEDLTVKVELDETLVQMDDTIEHCIVNPLSFSFEVNLLDYEFVWDFGDGTQSDQNPASHNYEEKRFYEASLIITTNEIGGCTFSSGDTLKFYIDGTQKYFVEAAELCKGETYAENGFDCVVTQDTLLGAAIDNPEHPHCPDSLLVYITTLPGYYASYSDTLCWTNQPFNYTDHGFDLFIEHPDIYEEHISVPIPQGCDSTIDLHLVVTDRIINPNPIVYVGCAESFTWNDSTYYEDGDYEQVFTSIAGCDSIVNLHIILSEVIEGTTDTITGVCNSYLWYGNEYFEDGFYTDTIKNAIGCDSIIHLDLNLGIAPEPSDILPLNQASSHYVIPATEFQINSYAFGINPIDPKESWDSVSWQLCKRNAVGQLVESDINWRIVEEGAKHDSCKVFVISYTTDTIWLRASAFNDCVTEGIHKEYWLVCSFYGTEEQSLQQIGFEVIPNPNNGQMELRFEHCSGKVDLKVYDMLGILIDQFQTFAHDEPNTLHYDLKGRPNGIYLFVMTTKDGSTARKVSVSN